MQWFKLKFLGSVEYPSLTAVIVNCVEELARRTCPDWSAGFWNVKKIRKHLRVFSMHRGNFNDRKKKKTVLKTDSRRNLEEFSLLSRLVCIRIWHSANMGLP